MRALLQRVTYGRVKIDGEIKGEIENGFVILLGVKHDDSQKDVEYLVEKISGLQSSIHESNSTFRFAVLILELQNMLLEKRKSREIRAERGRQKMHRSN